MSNLCVIPARGGSKRIPGKNIKSFLGQPIIAYSIVTAIQSGLFDCVMVSTDDAEIAKVAKYYGAEVPFIRSKEASDDFATTADVLLEVLSEFRSINKQFDYVCCVYPTAPFVNQQTLREAYDLIVSHKFDSVFPVCPFSYPIQRALEINHNKTDMIWPENVNARSQDLKKAYHDAGQFYWLNIDKFISDKKIFTSNSGAVILDELHVQDIDNEMDWKMAEIKFEMITKK